MALVAIKGGRHRGHHSKHRCMPVPSKDNRWAPHDTILNEAVQAYLVFHHHVLDALCLLAQKLRLVGKVLYCGIPGKRYGPSQ